MKFMFSFLNKKKIENFFCIEFFVVKFLWIFLVVPSQSIQLILISFFALINFKKIKNITVNKNNLLFLFWGIVYLFSMVLNMSNHNLKDVISTLMKITNFSFAVLLYSYLMNCQLDKKKIFKYFIIDIIIFLVCAIFYILDSNKGLSIKIFDRTLGYLGWVEKSKEFRFRAFLEYPTLIGTVMIMLLPLITLFKNKLVNVWSIFVIAFVVYLSKARISILVVVLFLNAYIFELLYLKIENKYKKIVILILCITLVCLFLLSHRQIYDMILRIFSSRSTSNKTRFLLYENTIKSVMNNNILFGNGVRIKDLATQLYYGSHSTYLSFFYRTGFIGLALGVVALIQLFIISIKNSKYKFTIFTYIVGLSLFMLFEEFDPQYYATILFFVVFGMLNNKEIQK